MCDRAANYVRVFFVEKMHHTAIIAS